MLHHSKLIGAKLFTKLIHAGVERITESVMSIGCIFQYEAWNCLKEAWYFREGTGQVARVHEAKSIIRDCSWKRPHVQFRP